ncbi:MAG: ParB/RepB/Spo0J family partition protein [Clostridia bacterium]|nr:ParB/RepB/Spo0J family partition protein [Clostridia bacterium]
MPRKTHGLGRGLDVLLPDTADAEQSIRDLPVGDIDPNPDQPRQSFSEESITQLAQSIRDQGVLQPLLVTPAGSRWRLIAGERRWRAAREAGLETVPCLVRELTLPQQMEVALIENLQREDLNPVETALGIRALMDQCGYTQEEAARRLAKSRPVVANLLRILSLPEDVIDLVRAGTLSAGHARVLAGLDSPEEQRALAEEAVRLGYNVRRMEEIAAQRREKPVPVPAKPARKPLSLELKQFENSLQERLGVRARISGNEQRGRIVLRYDSAEQLEALWETLEQLK